MPGRAATSPGWRPCSPRANSSSARSTERASGAAAIVSPSASIARPRLSFEPGTADPLTFDGPEVQEPAARLVEGVLEELEAATGALRDGAPAEGSGVEEVDLERARHVVHAVAVRRDPVASRWRAGRCRARRRGRSRCLRLTGWSGARTVSAATSVRHGSAGPSGPARLRERRARWPRTASCTQRPRPARSSGGCRRGPAGRSPRAAPDRPAREDTPSASAAAEPGSTRTPRPSARSSEA